MGSLRLSSSTEDVNESCLTLRMKKLFDELCLADAVVSIKLSLMICSDGLTRYNQAVQQLSLLAL